MTDDPLDQLQAALKRQTPAPSDTARDAALRAAAENFSAQSQGSADLVRQTPNRPETRAGIWTGVLTMLSNLTQPRVLMGTSALATLAIAVVLTQNFGDYGQTGVVPVSEEVVGQQSRGVAAPAPALTDELAESARVDALEDLRNENQPLRQNGAERLRSLDDGRTRGAAEQTENRGAQGQVDRAESKVSEFILGPNEVLQTGPELSAEPMFTAPPEPVFIAPESDTEAYPDATPNPLKVTADKPVSTFSIDVDTASYALIRQSLNNGVLPPRQAVRIEEMVNYFDYNYPAPDGAEVPFRTSVSVAPTPWNEDTQLLHIGIQGYDIAPADRPPLNLVFLIDTSGSMNDPKKLPLLIQSFKLLLSTLSEDDSVAIVTYAGSAGMALEPTPATESAKILQSLERLSAGGSTAGQQGLQQAYALAAQMSDEGEVSRVILATDGDFNVGISDPEALKDYIAEQRDSGTYLSVLGFGRGNYDDATLQSLAQNGNGTAAYIDTLAEAQKVLVEDVAGSLFPIAGDVKIQIEFNPAQISEYRLIGHETRTLNREDFNNDAVDAGEIGAGHQVTALYEITPKGSAAERVSDLRYGQATEAAADPSEEYAFLKLRYKRPGEARSQLIETPVAPDRQDIAATETGFAAAIAGFGMLLRGEALPGWSYGDARALAAGSRGEDAFGYRSEVLSLMRIAGAID